MDKSISGEGSQQKPPSVISPLEWRYMNNAVSAALFLVAPVNGGILEANHAAQTLFGYSQSALNGMLFQSLCEDFSLLCDDPCESHMHTCKCVTKAGEHFWAELSVKNLALKDIDYFVVTVHNIEREKQLEKRLKHSEELSRVIQRLNKIGIWEYEIAANKNFWTEEVYRIHDLETRIAEDDAQQVIAETLALYHPEDRKKVESRFFKCINDGDFYIVDARLTTFSGRQKWIETRGERVLDENGQYKIIGYMRDISMQKEAEEEKKKLQNQLLQSQKLQAVGRLAGGVAHDFNNMLGIILGQAELALLKTPPEHPLYSRLQEIIGAAKRSAEITRQLLAFASKQTIEPKQLNLNETVANMLKMLGRLIGEDIDLNWNPGTANCFIHIDPSQLDQIIINLMVNARDAVSEQPQVFIATDVMTFTDFDAKNNPGCMPGEFTVLSVSDNGCGMDKQTLENIFEPFFTTKSRGQGTGLGLATVYGIVKQNSGFIKVYSEPGQGTTFQVYLPRVGNGSDPVKATQPVIVRSVAQDTILLVEDEPVLLTMAKSMIESLGYQVLATSSPQEALQLANENKGQIHLLVTDVIMPVMSGLELMKNLKKDHPLLKILFMSGYTADIIAPHGLLEDGHHYLQKPFSRQDLSRKLHEVLSS